MPAISLLQGYYSHSYYIPWTTMLSLSRVHYRNSSSSSYELVY